MLKLLESRCKKIRAVPGNPTQISVYDALGGLAEYTHNHSVLLGRLCQQHPEVRTFCHNFKFPGQGQRDTPVADVRIIAVMVAILPGKAAAKFRKELLECPEAADEFLDAAAILQERGCTQEQISHLAGEFGKDLWLVAQSEARHVPTSKKRFGPETSEIKQYRRVADAKLVQDVFQSFRQRPLWQSVAADDQTSIQRQQLLAEQGRGRKRRRT